jgi:nitrite reductase/ring-hydroxylating ferredoxin subunit
MVEPEFVKVAEIGEVAPGEMIMVRLDRDQVLLANVDGTFYAINNMCSHKKGIQRKARLRHRQVCLLPVYPSCVSTCC